MNGDAALVREFIELRHEAACKALALGKANENEEYDADVLWEYVYELCVCSVRPALEALDRIEEEM